MRQLRQIGRGNGLELVEVRQGANHTIYKLGKWTFPVPRHSEVNKRTAKAILERARKEQ